jgi:IPT/TIG domain
VSLTSRVTAGLAIGACAAACSLLGRSSSSSQGAAPADTDSVPPPLPAIPDDAGPEPCDGGAAGPSFSSLPAHAGPGACLALDVLNADPTTQDVEVYFGDVPAEIASYDAQNQVLTVIVPDDAESGPVTLAVGCDEYTIDGFVVDEVPAPSIAGVSPSTVSEGQIVTITGSGFDLVGEVDFGGEAQNFVVLDAGAILALPVVAVTGAVSVQSYSGVGCSDAGITVTP